MSTTQPTKVVAHVKSDIGMVREHNEDSAFADPTGTYFVVADGMGGHAAGEVASAMAVEEVKRSLEAARAQIESFAQNPADDGRQLLVQVLEEAVRRAHQAVYERGGRESDKRGMGTTLDVLLVADGEAFVAHVGDSRTYLFRGGGAAQVTTDHTVAEVLVIEGKLSADEARLSPLRTILVNAIGVSADVGVELAHLKLRRGDKLLLCSDGLHDYFPMDNELAEVLRSKAGADGLGKLIDMAKERGGHDNITGVLVEVVEGNPLEAEDSRSEDDTAPITPIESEALVTDEQAAPAPQQGISMDEVRPTYGEPAKAKDPVPAAAADDDEPPGSEKTTLPEKKDASR